MKIFAASALAVLLASSLGPVPLAALAAPERVASPAPSATDAPAASFELSNNLILLPTRIGGAAPVWFVFDTGAESTVVDAATAKRLGLGAKGSVGVSGSGGEESAQSLGALALSVAGVSATVDEAYALPLGFLSAGLGREVGGILGNDVIGKFVVEIDYAARSIRMVDPAGYAYAGSGQSVPLVVRDDQVFVRSSVGVGARPPVEALLELDTGGAGAVSLNSPFVAKNGLLGGATPRHATRIAGVGGSVRADFARLDSLRIGAVDVGRPVARLSRATTGDSASADNDGLVGGDVLRRFRLVIDYGRSRMFLEPGPAVSEPYEVDMSGLRIAAAGDRFSTFVVAGVEAGSPAARGGVREGDAIVSVDGRAATALGLEGVRGALKRDGRRVALGLRRGRRRVSVVFVLRRKV